MNVLSLFDGMSCGQIALERAGIKVDNYFASEIDKYAIKVTMFNYPNTIQLGSIVDVHAKDLLKIDLVIGGSPCQGFSFAGKQLNFKDERSKLFFEYVRIWNEVKAINPNALFLLENVQMKYEHELVISRYMNVNPIVINSSLVSAQNRVRNYWTNINNKIVGMFGDMQPDIQQPKDKGILLKDILEKEVSDKYFLSDKMTNAIMKENPNKSLCIDANYFKGTDVQHYLDKSVRQIVVHNIEIKEHTVVVQLNKSKESNGCQLYQQNRVYDTNGKSPAHLAGLSSGTHAILDKSPCLHGFEHGTNGQLNNQLQKGGMIRRLTEVECERLQTVEDNYTNQVSSTQRYKMLGNGWNVDTIVHILSYLPSEFKK